MTKVNQQSGKPMQLIGKVLKINHAGPKYQSFGTLNLLKSEKFQHQRHLVKKSN